MRLASLRIGFSIVALMVGAGAASAVAGRPIASETFGAGMVATPAAMCGYTCRSGGRYIPGPPEVCYAEGLEYCGPSRGGGGGGYDRGGGFGPRGAAFDEDEYLRCHPDVRRAVRRGDMESGYVHYRRHGRGEGRRLSC